MLLGRSEEAGLPFSGSGLLAPYSSFLSLRGMPRASAGLGRCTAPAAMPLLPHRYYLTEADVFHVALHEPGGEGADVPEAFVQDLWAGRAFDVAALRTTDGQPVAVLDPGRLNTDAGPDFAGARLRIGAHTWAGDVEVHVTSGGWAAHGHDRDPAYDRTVLHVALRADVWTGRLRRADGTALPEVVLEPLLRAPVRRLLHAFHTRTAPDPPCAASWASVPPSVRGPWVRTLAHARLAADAAAVDRAVAAGRSHADVLHERLFGGLGYAKNAEPLRALARRLPLGLVALLARTAAARDVEALHLGTAGLLPTPADLLDADRATADEAVDYMDRYARLRARLGVEPLAAPAWRFFRLRPANFPPLRVAQAAALLRPGGLLHDDAPLDRLVAAVRAERPLPALRSALDAEPDVFWQTHVRFERRTRARSARIGRSRRDALLVNAVLPVLLSHARHDAALASTVRGLFEHLPAPSDEVTRRFAALGTPPRNALEAHGLHALYRTHCAARRCLTCAVGRSLLAPP